MSKKTEQWVYVEFYNAHGDHIGEYWMNHHDAVQRACLGMRCADTFAEGGAVFTARVEHNGSYPPIND